MTYAFQSFDEAFDVLKAAMVDAPQVKTERWQGVAANQDTRELLDVNLQVDLRGVEDLDHWRRDARPNLPWADDHFLERVGGEPLNPVEEWKRWPWGQSASKFRTQGRFNHTYMERLWPRYARRTADGKLFAKEGELRRYPPVDPRPKFGVTHHYGDLEDLVDLLAKEPQTRQAVIPLFFPEDTGVSDGGRKMCSLCYQVIVRGGRAHMWYPLRSCDLRRHWQDDAYLAVRMLLWLVDRCRERNGQAWQEVRPGSLLMHMTSLHVFEADWLDLQGKKW